MTKQNHLLVWILTLGVFGILTTEMGVIGILPAVADHYHISISQAGYLVSLFALVVAVSGPTMPTLFSGINRKKVMLLVLGVFILGNIVSMIATNFTVALLARVVPAFFHPIYCTLAFTVAAASVKQEEAPKAVAKVLMGVSAGMVLGVPIASWIASATSLQMAMGFFAVVNAFAFVATLLFVPSMPVQERVTYSKQVLVLKRPAVWLAVAAVLLLNSAIYGVYSYLAEFLQDVTRISTGAISMMLLIYGAANLLGNWVGGKLLVRNAFKSVVAFPILLGAVYILLFLMGEFTVPMALITLAWGILGGMGGNINQYWIVSAAPDAPDFANGLFLTSANLGTTFGTAIGGLFIAGMGTPYVVFAGFISLLLGLASILLRRYVAGNI